MEILTKEKSNQKRKSVNNQNNSSFYFELFPVINTGIHHYHYYCNLKKDSIKN
jgi:hypothetical protein